MKSHIGPSLPPRIGGLLGFSTPAWPGKSTEVWGKAQFCFWTWKDENVSMPSLIHPGGPGSKSIYWIDSRELRLIFLFVFELCVFNNLIKNNLKNIYIIQFLIILMLTDSTKIKKKFKKKLFLWTVLEASKTPHPLLFFVDLSRTVDIFEG